MTHIVKRGLSLSFCILWIFVSVGQGRAQDLNGSIVGIVKDPTGAIVPAAKVVAKNAGTSAEVDATALGDGSYTINVPPGVYQVTIDAAGFKSTRIEGIQVEVNTQSRGDAVLSIGTTSEVVNVAAISDNVDTQTSTIKETIGETTIEDAPLNGRNPLSLILLVPGVTRDPKANVTSGATYPGASGLSINGGRSDTTNYILDGATNNDNYTNAPDPLPDPDALREFSVQTNNFSAEFGRMPGGVVNAVSKSGVNQLHGSAFEYIRNNYFNAANYFSAVTNGVKSDDGLKRHQFGGTVGGPFFLPHLYDGRDRSFFFVSVQETIVHQRPNSISAVVPDAALRAGNFSGLPPLYVPYSAVPGQTYTNNQVPTIDPIAAAVLQFIPVAPAGTAINALGGQTIFFRTLNNTTDYQLLTRFDQHLTKKNTLYGTFFNSHQTRQPFLGAGNYLAVVNGGDWIYRRYQATDTHIITPTLLNEATFAYSHNRYTNQPIYPTASLPSLGANIFVPPGSTEYQFAVTGFFGMATGDTNTFIRDEYQGIETLRWSKGRHQMSFGGEYYFGTGDNINNFQQNPVYTYTASAYNAAASPTATSTGNAFGDFLTGHFITFLQGAGEYKNTRYNHFAGFAEDTFKATPRLVLNAGVRYEPFLPYYDLNNRLAVYRPGQTSTLYPNAPAGVLFVGDPGIPHGGFNASYKNIAPRVGLAYDVFGNGKTSLHVGYGIFFDQPNTITTNNQTDQAPFAPVVTEFGNAVTNNENPYAGTTSPFPYPSPPTKTSTFPQYSSQYLYSQRMRNAYTQSYNLQVQQDLGFGTIFSLAYAGSAATHLPVARELNAAIYIPGSSTTSNTNQRRPLAPALGSTTLLEAAGSSDYNSLQASIRHQFANSFSILANYTWSKALDTWSDTKTLSGARAIPSDPEYDHGPADFDRRNVINFTSIWKIRQPFQEKVAKAILGGWEHTTIFNYTGGYPFSILAGRDNALTGTPNQRVNRVPGQQIYLGKRPTSATIAAYFNPAAFAQPATGTNGNTGRNSVRGPGFTDVDMGLLKNFPIADRVSGTFRFEAFNVLNHTNLQPPVNTFTAGNVGAITAAYDPRILQFALRLSF